MTYYINIENTALETYEQVKAMALDLIEQGYDVEATKTLGAVNAQPDPSFDGSMKPYGCPVPHAVWERALRDASEI